MNPSSSLTNSRPCGVCGGTGEHPDSRDLTGRKFVKCGRCKGTGRFEESDEGRFYRELYKFYADMKGKPYEGKPSQ